MNSKDIDILLSEGEGLRIEFKSSFDNKVIETLVAFANTSGGSVLIGITILTLVMVLISYLWKKFAVTWVG